MLAKLGERFRPETIYGKASRRGAYIVVNSVVALEGMAT